MVPVLLRTLQRSALRSCATRRRLRRPDRAAGPRAPFDERRCTDPIRESRGRASFPFISTRQAIPGRHAKTNEKETALRGGPFPGYYREERTGVQARQPALRHESSRLEPVIDG